MTPDEIRQVLRNGGYCYSRVLAEIAAQLAEINEHLGSIRENDDWRWETEQGIEHPKPKLEAKVRKSLEVK